MCEYCDPNEDDDIGEDNYDPYYDDPMDPTDAEDKW